jgi:hypothetical protein
MHIRCHHLIYLFNVFDPIRSGFLSFEAFGVVKKNFWCRHILNCNWQATRKSFLNHNERLWRTDGARDETDSFKLMEILWKCVFTIQSIRPVSFAWFAHFLFSETIVNVLRLFHRSFESNCLTNESLFSRGWGLKECQDYNGSMVEHENEENIDRTVGWGREMFLWSEHWLELLGCLVAVDTKTDFNSWKTKWCSRKSLRKNHLSFWI